MSLQPDFGTHQVLLNVDGEWCDDSLFCCKSNCELSIPSSTSFQDLIISVRSAIADDCVQYVFRFSYLLPVCPPPVIIDDDSSLQFYLQLKSFYRDPMMLPLCVQFLSNLPNLTSKSVSPRNTMPLISHVNNSTHIGDIALANHLTTASLMPESGLQPPSSMSLIFSSDDNNSMPIGNNVSAIEENTMSFIDKHQLLFHPSFDLQSVSTSSTSSSLSFTMDGTSFDSDDTDYSSYHEVNRTNVNVDEAPLRDVISTGAMTSEELVYMSPYFEILSLFHPTTIAVDAIYESKKVLDYHLKMLDISNYFQYRTRKSTKKVLHVVCVDHSSCKWAVRAVRMSWCEMFQIRRYDCEHQCPVDVRQGKTHQATSSVVANLIKHQFNDVTLKSYPPKSIISDMLRNHGIFMSYKKAWFAKEKALKLSFGSDEESYGMLPSLCYMLQKSNPSSTIELNTSDNGFFKYFFMSLCAWKDGWAHCIPVLIIDGSFMKSYYKGTLLTDVTQDGNKQIFPLAFAICDAENTTNWNWFLEKVKEALVAQEVKYIVSDRHEGILQAVETVFPNVMHGHCIHHILGNIKASFRGSGKAITWKFIRAAKATTVRERDWYMRLLDEEDPTIQPYLRRIGFSKWSRDESPSNRYSIMTSNNAESMNSVDATPREYPIAQLIDFIIGRMQKWFHERSTLANSTSSILIRHYEAKLNELHASSAVMTVRPSCEYEFQVLDLSGRAFVVNLQSRSCTCCEFQTDHFVCVHVVAAIRTRPCISCYDFVSKYYTTFKWRAAYEGIIHPLTSRESWIVPEFVSVIVCRPPSCSKRPPGRPKKRRIPSRGETTSRQCCSRCSMPGHNKKTTNPLSKPRA